MNQGENMSTTYGGQTDPTPILEDKRMKNEKKE